MRSKKLKNAYAKRFSMKKLCKAQLEDKRKEVLSDEQVLFWC